MDIVLLSDRYLLTNLSVTPCFLTSDHDCIEFSLSLVPPIVNSESSRNFGKIDIQFCSFLLAVHTDWENLFSGCASVQDVYRVISTTIEALISLCVPNRSTSVDKAFIFSAHTIWAKKGKSSAHSRYRRNRSPYNLEERKYYDRLVKKFEKKDFSNFENQLSDTKNVKKFYSYVKARLKTKPRIPTLKLPNGDTAVTPPQRAAELNKFFSSVFTVDNGQAPTFDPFIPRQRLGNISFTPHRVFEVLRALPNKHSRGPDGVPPIFLRKFALHLSEPYAKLMNFSLHQQSLPNIWKTADVVPVFKGKGSIFKTDSYRPISQLCSDSKVMEKIIATELLAHCDRNGFLTVHQHGFVHGKSTLTQLLGCLNDWTSCIDTGSGVDIIYLDFAKAFDSVSHTKLIFKLRRLGVSNPLLGWIKDYLSNRSQRVVIDGVKSDATPVTSGVPQGSILGPLLFIIYINDITLVVNGRVKIRLYADDAKLYFRIITDADAILLEEALKAVWHWADDSQLTLALHKCVVVHLGRTSAAISHEYKVSQDLVLPSVGSMRDLGVEISCDLKPSTHCRKIANAAKSVSWMIFRSFSTRSAQCLVKLFLIYVRPKLEYISPVWSPWMRKDIDRIEGIQRFYTRKITGMGSLDYPARLLALHIQPLEVRRLHYDLIEAYKIIHGLSSLSFEAFFTWAPFRGRGHSKKLSLPKPKLDARKYFFSVRVVHVWNSLPEHVVCSSSLPLFKNAILQVDFSSFLRGSPFRHYLL